jgi:hypothetical protein
MRLAFACLVFVTGCDLYFSDGDDDQCLNLPAAEEIAPALELRNPDTGLCEPFGSGCDDPCAACEAAIPQPDWGQCFSGCEGLDEGTCIDSPSCRAVYNAFSDVDVPPQYLDCWSIAPSGPVTGACDGLDADECSRHADCSAFYDEFDGAGGPLTFFACKAEHQLGCFGNEDCANGEHCTTSDGECNPPPGCDPGESCPAVCFGRCIPN